MKNKILLAVALVACAFMSMPAQAQDEEEPRHEIAVSYGVMPNSIWIDIFSKIGGGIFGESSKNDHYVGPLSLEYYYHTSPLIGIGAVAVFSSNNEDGFYDNIKSSHIKRTYFTFMPSVKFNWLRKAHWGLYSKVAAGVTYAHMNNEDYDEVGQYVEDKTIGKDLLFNFQGTAIGIEAGGNHMRAFAELGVGEQGIALAGLRFKF